MGALTGIRVIEMAGIGPAPFCGMLLADMGADVILVDRSADRPGDPLDMGKAAIVHRGKRSIALDLKSKPGQEIALKLIDSADALIEGMRPGVMERLGLGPEVCLPRNPRLVYGRMTGWGQTGPLAQAAGHDVNYIALSGALWYSGAPDQAPMAPPTLVGDLGGGALYLAMGVLAGILQARTTGQGQVVDAAIVDGSANMMNLMLALHATGHQPMERGRGLLDGPHWYGTFICADGLYISIGALEPQFYALLLQKLGLSGEADLPKQYDARHWPAWRARFADLFQRQPRQHWIDLLEGTDVCFAPVLNPKQAARHPHIHERSIYRERAGVFQAEPAPRFSVTPSNASDLVPHRGQHSADILRSIGVDPGFLLQPVAP